ncbi:MAG: type II toxin-antitoxin system RelE/ParE family toxin [Gemmatimonadota bacterium]
MTRLVWTEEAIADLEAIRDFIARTSPHYGNVVVARLVEAVDRVTEFPRSGRVVPELQREDLREIIHGLYRIVYRLRDQDSVAEVTTVNRASRRFPGI